MSEIKLNILDCTLRDGGYYNDWDFEAEMVLEYLDSIAEAELEFVELGLRQLSNTKYRGAHAYTTQEYLNGLKLPEGPTYGVMIDAKAVLSEKISQQECIDKLFLDASDEKISLVRVAAQFREVSECFPMLERLKNKGYIVGLNIMQASLQSDSELMKLAAIIGHWECVDVVYFADSLGSMDAPDVERVYNALRSNWNGDLGFHAHNNMGQAISNTMKAVEVGCNWVDSTVTGMGRGAGNAQTEYLLLEPNIQKPMEKLSSLFNLVAIRFEELKRSCGWGTSVPYFISAMKNIHPTYVQELCADSSLQSSLLPEILMDLGETSQPHIFNKTILENVKSSIVSQEKFIGGVTAPNILVGRELLLVAQTDSTVKYQSAIADYAKKKDAILMSINFPELVPNLAYDYIVVSHNEKFREDGFKYLNTTCPYIAPKKLFPDNSIDVVFDYGFSIKKNVFENHGSYSDIPFRLTLAYAIGFCLDAGADTINLAGFSGFDKDDSRQKEMESFLSILSRSNLKLISLTPTSFSIEERSIYAI